VPELVPQPTAAPTVLVRVDQVANLDFQIRAWKQKLGEKTYELNQARAETCQLRSALALASLEVEELKPQVRAHPPRRVRSAALQGPLRAR
jgi:predicted  nucleic acid-binding Zn-ribbon protein